MNKIFNAPTGAKAETDGDQAGEFIKRGRRPPLYAAQEAVENPTVTIWGAAKSKCAANVPARKEKSIGRVDFRPIFYYETKKIASD
ncbi:MAG: hypothetical protein LBK73_15815 [Treponema sp.]|nr:hypothetical protein [Treponema sp.]